MDDEGRVTVGGGEGDGEGEGEGDMAGGDVNEVLGENRLDVPVTCNDDRCGVRVADV